MFDSYLRYAPRWRFSPSKRKTTSFLFRIQRTIPFHNYSFIPSGKQLEENLNRLVFLCIVRLSTYKESPVRNESDFLRSNSNWFRLGTFFYARRFCSNDLRSFHFRYSTYFRYFIVICVDQQRFINENVRKCFSTTIEIFRWSSCGDSIDERRKKKIRNQWNFLTFLRRRRLGDQRENSKF